MQLLAINSVVLNKIPHLKKSQAHLNSMFSQIGDKLAFSSSSKNEKNNNPKVYKFGTSGYREIGEKFNNAIPVIVDSITDYLINNFKKSNKTLPVLVGGDTREISGTNLYKVISQLTTKNLDTYFCQYPVPTPALAYAAKYFNKLGVSKSDSAGAILLTASHNPWEYGGINFLTPDGEVAPNEVSSEFVKYQLNPTKSEVQEKRALTVLPVDYQIFEAYKSHLTSLINFEKIKNAGISINYDGLYGAGRQYFPKMLLENSIPYTQINNDYQPPTIKELEAKGLKGPEPSGENLKDLSNLVKDAKPDNGLKVGLANDGDADRFGVVDEKGNILNPNEVLALTLYHLAKNKNRQGIVVRSQATSHMLDELAKKYGMKVVQTPVGYKYIAEVFKESKTPVVIGGESSGGLSIYGHIPEKDGIIANLSILELMAYDKKPVGEILKEIKKSLPNHYQFTELAINTEKKDQLGKHFENLLKNGGQFADQEIDVETSNQKGQDLKSKFHVEDGTKIYFKDGSWLLYRKSGTEPLGRIYFEAIGASKLESMEKQAKMRKSIDELLASPAYQIPASAIKQKV